MTDHKEPNKEKIPLRIKVGYAAGQMTDTLCYDFVTASLLFFLITFTGLSPAFASSVVTVGILWDMITDPVIGSWCDRTHTRFGNKRVWLLLAIPVLAMGYLALFSLPELSMTGKKIWYMASSLVFWLGYTLFDIPYYAMGASLTSDNEERSQIRMLGQFLQYIAVLVSTVAPTALVDIMLEKGVPEGTAWQYVGWIECGCATTILILVFLLTKGAEKDTEPAEEKPTGKNIVREFLDIATTKPFVSVTMSSLMYRVGYGLQLSTLALYLLYYAGLSYTQVSLASIVLTVGGLFLVALYMRLVKRFDKAWVYVVALGISGTVMMLFGLVTRPTLELILPYAFMTTVGEAAYWSINFSLMYDVVEVDEFQNGTRKEGTMFSIYLFFQKAGFAIASTIVGIILTKVGWEEELGAANSALALNAVRYVYTTAAGLAIVISALVMVFFPLKKKAYANLLRQLEHKRRGEPFSTNGMKRLLKKKFYEEHLKKE